jgi:hypothetical protein
MWDDIMAGLAEHQDAVLTGVDARGYPFSIRCKPVADQAQELLRIEALLGGEGIQAGAASLMCHSHNEALWELKAFMIRGELRRADEAWLFKPQAYLPGLGYGNQFKGLMSSRRAARNYLEKRGLPRPAVRWDQIKALRKEAEDLARRS